MKADRHRYWESYIRDLQSRMLMGQWRFILRRESPPESHALAQIECRGSTHEAFIWLGEDFDDHTRMEQRRCIVHELLHAHLWPLKFHLRQQFPCGDDIHLKNTYGCIETGHHSHEEFIVDDLARIIAPSMPLPLKVKV